MPESHINKLAKIDARLQLLNEERFALLNDRQALITQHEAELAQNFNLHASPESPTVNRHVYRQSLQAT